MIIFLLVFVQSFSAFLFTSMILKTNFFRFKKIIATIVISISISVFFQFVGVYVSIFMFMLIFLINYYYVENSIDVLGATSYVMIILVLSDHLAQVLEKGHIFGDPNSNFYGMIQHVILALVIGRTLVYLLVKLMDKYRLDNVLKKITAIIGFVTLTVYYACIYLGVYLGNSFELIQLNLIFFVIYLIMTIMGIYFYSESLKKNYEMKQKETEYQSLERYTEEIEQHYTEMRKFRHDYQNVLSSLDSFIEENDYDGLKTYYSNHIKKSMISTVANNFKLENLGNLKVKEVKSIIATKLIYAQELGINAAFEGKELIEKIAMDPIILVRIIGIILDNAIEELQVLKTGKLVVAIFKESTSVHFIIQNSCRKDIPKVYQLKEEGFSTKGNKRGLGLSNVEDLLRNCPNIIHETVIEGEKFTQVIIIDNKELGV